MAPELVGLQGVFAGIVASVLALAGIAFFIMFIVGGFNWLTSGGNPEKVGKARNTLTYAIGGLVLIALAFLILRFIAVFTGVDAILFFKIRQ
ncbi:hypothetical protein HY008_01365 [Candidatus Woesebacteria bacterium]|nr:hypothetical protein [Candidatus Woesebacteria bacterium]